MLKQTETQHASLGSEVYVIDGAQGEGGGQIFRSALTLAMCLGVGVRIDNIRAGRRKPGLLRQHLTCLRAAQEISDATVVGANLGSTGVTFMPGKVRAGKYRFSVGSAGSTTLVFQTVVLPLLLADQPSDLTLEGGTHNGMAPSYDFIAESYVPMLRAMGCELSLSLHRHGFYPHGGGSWEAQIYPAGARFYSREPVRMVSPGKLIDRRAVASSAHIPAHVGERELKRVQRKCHWAESTLENIAVDAHGPGNIVSLRLRHENACCVFEALGERGISAERVAGKAMRRMHAWQRSEAAIEEYLADQLLLPLLLGAGGSFTTNTVSEHLRTNINVIQQMTGVDISVEDCGGGVHLVNIPSMQNREKKR